MSIKYNDIIIIILKIFIKKIIIKIHLIVFKPKLK